MATEKKSEGLSVEQRMKALYELQTILSEIDRIKQIRGELPLRLKTSRTTSKVSRPASRTIAATLRTSVEKHLSKRRKSTSRRLKIARYKEQLDNVRNNREFDLLSKEVEFQTLEIELSEKHLNEFARAIDSRNADIAATEEKLSDSQHILQEKKAELDEIVSETRQDEERLRVRAKEIEPTIDERTLKAFKRIRDNARNGLGIVYIQRNACGGCFNRIPPQKQMEIKMHKKVIVCEYCGRIMIDPELAGIAEAEVAAGK